jgi:tight adherence protein B
MSALLLLAIGAIGVGSVAIAVAGAGPRARRRARARLSPPATPAAPAAVRPARPTVGALVVGALGLAAAWVTIGPRGVAALAIAAAGVRLRSRFRARAAHRRLRDAQLPLALDRLAASLRSGASLTMALGEVGGALDAPIGPELDALARDAAHGRPVRQVLDDWSSTHDDPGTRLAAAALVLATIVGSAPARAIDGVAATVRERLDLAAERRALAAQARTSALVLSVAPVGFAALLVLADAAAAGFLLGTPAGWACLVTGVGLDAAGAWWMARLSGSER